MSLATIEFLEDEPSFPPTTFGRKMSNFEDHLRCPICCEFFDNPMALRCGHSYCSECIRRHLDSTLNKTANSRSCPTCSDPAEPSHLHPAKTVDNALQLYKSLRSELLATMSQEPELARNASNTNISNKRTSSRDNIASAMNKKKREVNFIPQKNFHGLSLKKAKDMVSELCEKSTSVKLSLEGDVDTLAKRHRDFIHLNNSQLHSEKPLSLEMVSL